MRLAVVIERYDPDAGGAEKSTAQIVDALLNRGHHVTLIAGSAKPDVVPPGVELRRYARKKSSSVFRLLGFARWARRELEHGGFDASLSITVAVPASVLQPRGGTVRETLDRNVAMRPAGWKQSKKRLEVALDAKQRLLLALERRTLRDPSVHAIAAVSGYVVDQLERHYGIAPSRCRVIPNASVMPEVTDEQKRRWRGAIRTSFGIADDATVFLFAAQNAWLKGVQTLLPAMRSVIDAGVVRDPVLLMIGGTDVGAQERAADLGLRQHVRYLGHSREMPALFAAADVTVLPSWYDPSSKVVLESLMMGTPAISTAFNGASDHLRRTDQNPDTPVRGRVIADPGDAAALAVAMTELSDPAERARCAAVCAGLADHLSMTRHVDALGRLLAEAAAARAG